MLSRTRRRLAAGAVALAAAALFATPALAQDNYIFISIPATGQTSVSAGSVTFGGADPHIEIVRGGAVIARSTSAFGGFGTVRVASLNAGDAINLVRNGAVAAATTFDGTPTINGDACAGRSSYTGTRSALAKVEEAGAFTPGRSPYSGADDTRAIWSRDNPFTVTLDRPLGPGQVAFVSTSLTSGALALYTDRQAAVGACPAPPQPVPATPTTTAPSDAQVLLTVRTSLGKIRAKLRKLDTGALAKRKSVVLAFDVAEAGKVKLELTAKGKKIGTGTSAIKGPGTANVTVKLTKAGRSLLKRSKSIKLTLKATFTPARTGAKPQSASTSVTLKRKKKK